MNIKSWIKGSAVVGWLMDLRRRINGSINGDAAADTEIMNYRPTTLLSPWIVSIFDAGGERVYYEPLRFSRRDKDDVSNEIIHIGRSAGEEGDIQILEQWPGSEYVSREHAVLLRSVETGEMKLIDNCSRNMIENEDGNYVYELPVADGTTVLLAGVIRMTFQNLGRAGVAEEELKKKESRRNIPRREHSYERI